MSENAIQSNAGGDLNGADFSQNRWKRKLWTIAGLLILVGAALAAYSNSYKGVFIFDDDRSILRNKRVHEIWPIWIPWQKRAGTRPLVDLTLKLNYAAADQIKDPTYPKLKQIPDIHYFHVFNLAVHILAGLTLFGIVRRTLRTDRLRNNLGRYADGLAILVASIWLTHPLNTSAVTYIIQRAESMMGLFYLLTLYCAIRSFNSRRPVFWGAAGVLACLAGVGCKQVIVTVPVMVLLYDWVFISNGKLKDLRKRWPLHLSLFLTWVPLFAMSFKPMMTNPTAGFSTRTIGPLGYVFTQFGVILHYLKLSFWPGELCMDYMWPEAESISEILLPAIPILGMVALTVWALKNKPALGFLGAWFFLVLAPTSSIMPIMDLAFEHRMYVPLTAVIALVVIGGFALAQRLLTAKSGSSAVGVYAVVAILCIAAAGALGMTTYKRNYIFSDRVIAWTDVAQKRPVNSRARYNLGNRLSAVGRDEESEKAYRKAIELRSDYAEAQYNLGNLLRDNGQTDEAIIFYKLAIQNRKKLKKRSEAASIYNNLASVLVNRDELDEAMKYYQLALKTYPNYAQAYSNMGVIMDRQGKTQEAIAYYRKALELNPDYAQASNNLAKALKTINAPEAAKQYELAFKDKPEAERKELLYQAYNSLAVEMIKVQKHTEALEFYAKALPLKPDDPEIHRRMGTAADRNGDHDQAIAHLDKAISLKPDFEKAHGQLASVLMRSEQFERAVAQYEIVHKDTSPDQKGFMLSHVCLDAGKGLVKLGKSEAAIECFKKAVEYDPERVMAHKLWGDELAKMGDFEGQIEQYETGLAEKDEDFRNRELLRISLAAGKSLLEAGKVSQGETVFRKVLDKYPENDEAKFGLAQVAAQQGKVDEAIETCPQTAGKMFKLGRIFQKNNNVNGGIAAYQRTIELKDDHVNAYNSLALLYYRKQQFANAIEQFEIALKFEPGNIPVKRNLAGLFAYCPDISLRNGEKAVELAVQVCQTSEFSNPVHVNVLAAAYAQAGEFDKAIATSEKAIVLANQRDQSYLASQFQKRLDLFKTGKPVPGK